MGRSRLSLPMGKHRDKASCALPGKKLQLAFDHFWPRARATDKERSRLSIPLSAASIQKGNHPYYLPSVRAASSLASRRQHNCLIDHRQIGERVPIRTEEELQVAPRY